MPKLKSGGKPRQRTGRAKRNAKTLLEELVGRKISVPVMTVPQSHLDILQASFRGVTSCAWVQLTVPPGGTAGSASAKAKPMPPAGDEVVTIVVSAATVPDMDTASS